MSIEIELFGDISYCKDYTGGNSDPGPNNYKSETVSYLSKQGSPNKSTNPWSTSFRADLTAKGKSISEFKNTWTKNDIKTKHVYLKIKKDSTDSYKTISKSFTDKYSCSQKYKFNGISNVKIYSDLFTGQTTTTLAGSKTFYYNQNVVYNSGGSRETFSAPIYVWWASSGGTNTAYISCGYSYKGQYPIHKDVSGQITITAKCKYVKNGNGTSSLISSGSYSYTLPTAPTFNGWRFKHWEDSNGNIVSGTITGLRDDVTYIAVYRKLTTEITYKNLYTVSNTLPTKYTLGQQINYNNFTFSRDGYIFNGLSVDGGGSITNGVFTPPADAGDVIIIINWKPITYYYKNKLKLEGSDILLDYFDGSKHYSGETETTFTPDDSNNPEIKNIRDLDLTGYIGNSSNLNLVTSVGRPNNWNVEVGKLISPGFYSNKYGDLDTVTYVNTIKYNIDFKELTENSLGPTFYDSPENISSYKKISDLNISNLVKFDNYTLSEELYNLLSERKDLKENNGYYYYDILSKEIDLNSNLPFYNDGFKFNRNSEYQFGLAQGFYPTKYDNDNFYKIKSINGKNYINFYRNKINVLGPYGDHSDIKFSQIYQRAKYVFRYHYKYNNLDRVADSNILSFGDVINSTLPAESKGSIWPVGENKVPELFNNFSFLGWEDTDHNLVIGYDLSGNLTPLTDIYSLYQKLTKILEGKLIDPSISKYIIDGKISLKNILTLLDLDLNKNLISETNPTGTVDISSLKKLKESLPGYLTDEGYLYLYKILIDKPKYFCRKSKDEFVLVASKNNSGEKIGDYDEYTRVIDLYPRWVKNQGLQVNNGTEFNYPVESKDDDGNGTNLDYIKVYDNGWKQAVLVEVFDGHGWQPVNINQRPPDPEPNSRGITNPTEYQEI